jgi:glycosyltransferase involved in cell wall biosynthesis
MIPELVDAGHRVTVFANSKKARIFSTEDGRVSVHHFRLPATHWYAAKIRGVRSFTTLPLRQLEWSAGFYRQVAGIAERDKIDVLESGETGALFLSRIAPLVIRLHGSEFAFRKHAGLAMDQSVRWNDSLEAYSSQRAAAITSPSQFQAHEITNQRGWPADRVRVIPNPISATMLKAGLEFERNGGSEPIVLYTGRLAPVKGIETLLAAAKIVHDRNPAITFMLAGPWQMPQSPRYHGLELNRRSEHGVQWVGSREQSELADLYRRASLFVMPSYYESFGISVIEAMAFGLPVVCTHAGALPELVQDRLTGRVVSPGDRAALAGGILQSLDQLEESHRMSETARTYVLNNFTVQQTLRATLRVYSCVQGISDSRSRELERTADAASLGGQV